VYYGVDELRVRPLFIGQTENGDYMLCSEQKALVDMCGNRIEPVHSGTVGTLDFNLAYPDKNTPYKYFPYSLLRSQTKFQKNLTWDDAAHRLRDLLVENVNKKLNQRDREFGFLLSGGLDSSLVCAIAARILHPIRIKTFTIGFSKEAPDVLAARKVAKHIDSIHTEVICTFQDGIDEIENVIYYNESWDQTTTRASVPMRLALLNIKKLHPEMAIVYSGEVADELLRGYLYNLNSPDAITGRLEALRRCEDITFFDGLRADRVVSSVGCELRLPFFSKDLLRFVFSLPPGYIDPQSNENIEKKLLRAAFDHDENGTPLNYLPNEILWRTKNAMSDATSKKSGWKEIVKEYIEKRVTDSRFRCAETLYPYKTPQTKEDMYYREIFDEHSYVDTCIPYKWMPSWCAEDLTDSSATVLKVFHED
jgi:asparagine synthase (glutamine-hydrolysing)